MSLEARKMRWGVPFRSWSLVRRFPFLLWLISRPRRVLSLVASTLEGLNWEIICSRSQSKAQHSQLHQGRVPNPTQSIHSSAFNHFCPDGFCGKGYRWDFSSNGQNKLMQFTQERSWRRRKHTERSSESSERWECWKPGMAREHCARYVFHLQTKRV